MFTKNRICQLLGIKYPIIQGGMVWCSGWRLATAVSSAGGLGVLGSGSMDREILAEHLHKLKQSQGNPFGVNVPLMHKHADACLELCIAERVPVVITSAGSPSRWTERLHEAGIKVGHVVASKQFVRKAESAGVDFLIAEGFEAGGHNSFEELTSLVLTQLMRDWTGLPYLAAGGFHDGLSLLAALSLGADGVQVGSRFACTIESSADNAAKAYFLKAQSIGTVQLARRIMPTRMMRNEFSEQLESLENQGASPQEILEFIGHGRSKMGIFEGNLQEGEMEIGQIAAAFNELPHAAQVVEEMVNGFAYRLDFLHDTLRKKDKTKES